MCMYVQTANAYKLKQFLKYSKKNLWFITQNKMLEKADLLSNIIRLFRTIDTLLAMKGGIK